MRRLILLTLAGVGCADPTSDGTGETDVTVQAHSCGDGVTDPGEQCDDGEGNDDTLPNACRTTCVLPTCGDGVADAEEACDDGNPWGGDGCGPTCAAELGDAEIEPNDLPIQASPLTPGTPGAGALPDQDIDCWSVPVTDNDWISARVTGPDGTCPPETTLRLYDQDGDLVGEVYPEAPEDCVQLDPSTIEGARYLEAGDVVVCVEGLFRSEVPAYQLRVEVGDDSCLSDFVPGESNDLDGDGVADPCDSDDDDDGVADELDNCPTVPNNGTIHGMDTSDEGFLRHWLLLGSVTDRDVGEGGSCDPSADDFIADDEADAAPAIGDAVGGYVWWPWFEPGHTVALDDILGGPAPHEAYAFTWVHSDVEQAVTLAWGADDGSRVWLNGSVVRNDPTCHGTVTDQFQEPVTLLAGWNRLLIKVRDHGGGFGFKARFKDDLGRPLTTLKTSFIADDFSDTQQDSDGDGDGDLCDRTP